MVVVGWRMDKSTVHIRRPGEAQACTDQLRSGEPNASRKIRFALNKTRPDAHVIINAPNVYKALIQSVC